ncbi:16S rRNA (guanine(527)-N(7))-methyltransferase RsmG [Corynebacterium nuruki]|jgi:16S rRNA (guanine527-N7)-methyltransferase|uniref:Ribosomal RNA small subunit methyltransferase G n=1 Tax=Corynebacterium nuruki TaxID=1032851 RepID=A0A3D4T1V3_9CORY|nr:16S rRNA (guanine(527)-N(7))-methyltransferase RsmG [Corynebacterium nuruki]MDN6437899.1 16S rRNA (guanine(527)-N(7))-methyltransferase RsmG [Corynebacterium nuruki]HCT15295.1 16S rRNA (guanine(527)-N(7))-methyltransferase RsmG [Corynebacterium nuruki]
MLVTVSNSDVSEAARRIFGDRIDLAERYADWLAGAGVERGLIGPREADRLWERHILNSAVLGEVVEEGVRVVDIGSGAGLPGIPLAIARPDLQVQLVEPLLRRTTFLDEVVADLGLDTVEVHRGRAEEKTVRRAVGGADVVTSRAVAPLGKLMGWSLPLAKVGGYVRAMKGSSVAEEFERDADQIAKAGGVDGTVREIGGDLLGRPTYIAEVRRAR